MTLPARGRATYDTLWKALPEAVTLALVRTRLPAITAPLTPWRTDLAVVTDREIDGAFLVEVDGAPVLLHLEYQNYLDATMPRRMHEYASLLEQQYQQQQRTAIDVIPFVIWAVPGKTPEPVYQRERFGKCYAAVNTLSSICQNSTGTRSIHCCWCWHPICMACSVTIWKISPSVSMRLRHQHSKRRS